MSEKIAIVIPCYNEERRFVPERFTPLLDHKSITLLMVNDGSDDRTLAVLKEMAGRFSGRCHVLDLPSNVGKAEAVRRGLIWAVGAGADVVGYLDADGATPGEEMLRLVSTIERERKSVVLAARVAMAGHHIDRRPLRHYIGRLFATCASVTLGCTIYDTQCGAKLFQATPAFIDAIQRPFCGRWAFDVDLLGRLLSPENPDIPSCPVDEWIEIPLKFWCDEPGSKLTLAAMLGMGRELLDIYFKLLRRRRTFSANSQSTHT
jgi:glycosyltransferase involved in cell wall biosynthesis